VALTWQCQSAEAGSTLRQAVTEQSEALDADVGAFVETRAVMKNSP
jgi:hypothetical protein